MTHVVTFPSADPSRGKSCAELWISKGYLPLVMVDNGIKLRIAGAVVVENPAEKFEGYYRVINDLCHAALSYGDVVTAIGDDMDPPEQGAEYVEKEYLSRWPEGEGVLQPTGDRAGIDGSGKAASERVCGSPVLGRGWINLAYQGNGPFHNGYRSFYSDEELLDVALKGGLLWQRNDIAHPHRHWSWGLAHRQHYHDVASTNWNSDHELYRNRKLLGFPGSGFKEFKA